MPEEMQAAASAPVEATTRAVKVDAFMPCSAAEMKYASTALTWRGSGSPRQRFMKRSTMVRRLVDLLLRHGRQAEAAGRLGHERQRGDRDPGQVLAGLLVGDVQQLAQAPVRREHGHRGLDVDPDVAGVHRHRERLGRRQAGAELAVDQQRPDVAEGDPADQILDVDAAIAQRAAFPVGLGDLGLEGDHALQAGLERRWRTSRTPDGQLAVDGRVVPGCSTAGSTRRVSRFRIILPVG